MRFRKFHGIGNDFVMIEDYAADLGRAGSLPRALVAALCDRRKGVGADGVIRILASDPASTGAILEMDYYNADGAAAQMCGNGIRCLAVIATEAGRLPPGEQSILTAAGVRTVEVIGDGRVRVGMGAPSTQRPDVPMAGEGSAVDAAVQTLEAGVVTGTGVTMGNPHFVIFSDQLSGPIDDALVTTLGPALETHAAFPERTNVEFVTVHSADSMTMRVWERGVGETQACGTGACAVVVAAALTGRASRHATVTLPGGQLEIEWTDTGQVLMTGPAEEVFAATADDKWLKAVSEVVS